MRVTRGLPQPRPHHQHDSETIRRRSIGYFAELPRPLRSSYNQCVLRRRSDGSIYVATADRAAMRSDALLVKMNWLSMCAPVSSALQTVCNSVCEKLWPIDESSLEFSEVTEFRPRVRQRHEAVSASPEDAESTGISELSGITVEEQETHPRAAPNAELLKAEPEPTSASLQQTSPSPDPDLDILKVHFGPQLFHSDFLATSERVERILREKASLSTGLDGMDGPQVSARLWGDTEKRPDRLDVGASVHQLDQTCTRWRVHSPPADLHYVDDLNNGVGGCAEFLWYYIFREFVLDYLLRDFVLQHFLRIVRTRRYVNGRIPLDLLHHDDSLRFCRILSPFYEGLAHGSGFLRREEGARWFLYTARHNLADLDTPPSDVPNVLVVVLDHGANPNWKFRVKISIEDQDEGVDFLRQELREDNVPEDLMEIIRESEEWHRGLCTAIVEQLKCKQVRDGKKLFGCTIGYPHTTVSLRLAYLWDHREDPGDPSRKRLVSFVSFKGNSGGAVLKLVDGDRLEVVGVITMGKVSRDNAADPMCIDGVYVTLQKQESPPAPRSPAAGSVLPPVTITADEGDADLGARGCDELFSPPPLNAESPPIAHPTVPSGLETRVDAKLNDSGVTVKL